VCRCASATCCSPARRAVERLLAAHEPWPALAIDRHWNLVSHNRAVAPFLAGVEPALLVPPVNVMRLSLHPGGLAPRIVNLGAWRAHALVRLRQQVDASGDTTLAALLDELAAYPAPRDGHAGDDLGGVVVPLQLRLPDGGVLSVISTTTVFGTPVDVTLSELALETFFPADEASAQWLRRLGDGQTAPAAT
jgi:hypothetical protein